MKPADRTPDDLAHALRTRRDLTPIVTDRDRLRADLRAAGLDLDPATRQLRLYVEPSTPNPNPFT